MTNFFQSASWSDFQRALGEEVVAAEGDGWHFWGRFVRDNLGSYLYLPYGPVALDEKALDKALTEAQRIAREHGAYRLVAEPAPPITPEVAAHKFARQLFGFQPSRTQIVDLTQDEEAIVAGMKSSRRSEWRASGRKGMTFSEAESRAEFETGVELLRISAAEKSFHVREANYFDLFWKYLVEPGIARVFVGRFEDTIQVVAFVIDDEDTRYYLFVARDLSNPSLRISAPFITYLMLEAKSRGLKYFDLFGLSARDDVVDDMSGFTEFKQSFGGETVQYAGTWDLGIQRLKYSVRKTVDAVRSPAPKPSPQPKTPSAR